MDNSKKQLIKTLLTYGALNAKISKKQKMKLKEWIIPYLIDELNFNGLNSMKIMDMRKLIDKWETEDLNEKDYKYYYVNKDSDGKSLWDLI